MRESAHQRVDSDEPSNFKPMVEANRNKRVLNPSRICEIPAMIYDDLIDENHRARLIWKVLETMDLTRFSENVRVVEGRAGRSALCPRMLLTLWIYAISVGIGSARELARKTKTDLAFRWIVADLEVGHHTLSSFRIHNGEALEALMTSILASLLSKQLISLDLVSQDGTRTRAAASAPSFRTKGSLLECREQAALHLKAVLANASNPEYTSAQHARRAIAARDFQQRIEAAIETVNELQQSRGASDKLARASTTDADARVMKMGDGGFRPAYNVQYSTAGSPLGGPRAIVAVRVTNSGSDMGSLSPMAEQVKVRTGTLPKTVMADGGHAKSEDIIAMKNKGIDILVPPADNAKSIEQLRTENGDLQLIAWRERMQTEDAKTKYRARAGIVELSNAHQKSHHGLTQFVVKGLPKVTCVALLHAITSNLVPFASKLMI